MISSSMSAKGCYRNNAVVESFLSTLKHELVLNDDAETLNTPPAADQEIGLLDRRLLQPRESSLNDWPPQPDHLRSDPRKHP
jgi:hypothetical protein